VETVNEYVGHESDENSSTDDDDSDEDNEQIHGCVRDGAQDYVSDEEDAVSSVSVPKPPSATSTCSSSEPDVYDLTEDRWENYCVYPLADDRKTRSSDTKQFEDVKGVLPKFNPRGNVGSRVNKTPGAPLVTTVLQYFSLFFCSMILGRFIDQTNKYGKYNYKRWKDVDLAEFKTFLAIILHFGIVKYPQRDMPWRKNSKFSSIWVQERMREYRFNQLLRCWHWDATVCSPKERAEKNKADCFWTVKSFLDKLAGNFLHWYDPDYRCNIDEGVFGFKGRHRARCYNPNKPEKWHFKSFCLNCSTTGYLMNFFMYQGKDEQRPAGVSATAYPVHKLTEPDKFRGKNIILATDNWYTSIALAIYLLFFQIYLFGTCRANVAGAPKSKIFKKTGKGKKSRGAMNCEQTKTSVDGQWLPIFFTSWMDNKPVHFISTFATKKGVVGRVEKVNNVYTGKRDVDIPTLAMIYNWCMGGTDQFDQMLSYYKTTIKTKRWAVRIFTHFLMCAVVNAHILYKLDNNLTRNEKGFQLLDFIDMLTDQLSTTIEERNDEGSDNHRYSGPHTPLLCTRCTGTTSGRGYCFICRKRIQQYCLQCNVPLCFAQAGDKKPSCFAQFHTKPE